MYSYTFVYSNLFYATFNIVGISFSAISENQKIMRINNNHIKCRLIVTIQMCFFQIFSINLEYMYLFPFLKPLYYDVIVGIFVAMKWFLTLLVVSVWYEMLNHYVRYVSISLRSHLRCLVEIYVLKSLQRLLILF